MGPARPGARVRLRDHRRGVGADHRLSLRARPCNANVDHGRGRQGRRARPPDQERRGSGTARDGRHDRRRQDRHADRGQARGHCDHHRAEGIDGERTATPRCKPRAQQRASAGCGDRPGCEERGSRSARRTGVGQGRRDGGSQPGSSASRAPWQCPHRDGQWRGESRCPPREGATAIYVAIEGKVAGAIGIADPIRTTTPRRTRRVARRGCPCGDADGRQPHHR